MASIQILEISPVEYEVEELSYDITLNIRGGEGELTSPLGCIGQFFIELALEIGNEVYDPGAILDITGRFLNCLGFVANPETPA